MHCEIFILDHFKKYLFQVNLIVSVKYVLSPFMKYANSENQSSKDSCP